MKTEIYRQGDVLLVRTESVPETAVAIPDTEETRIVLAYGEVTGHAHAIAVKTAQVFADGDVRYLKVAESGAKLVHEEHSAIDLSPGVYRIVHQREYEPNSSRYVLD